MSHLVLVVDDDAAIRAVTAEVLRADGQEVRYGPLPELVLLDLMMPGTTGWEVLQGMYDDPRLATVPVVVLTSLDSRDGLPVGPITLHKPVDSEVLLDVVHALLDRHDAFLGRTDGLGRADG
jgi:two-component system, chemotaxis family, chemotaxis protein CheY